MACKRARSLVGAWKRGSMTAYSQLLLETRTAGGPQPDYTTHGPQQVTQAQQVTPPQQGTLAERTRLTADRLAYLAEGTLALCRRHSMWRSFRTYRDHYDDQATEMVG